MQEVEKITWAYKLSPESVNLPASEGVQEIQVIKITLRTDECTVVVLQTIDRAIPSPILFVLEFGGRVRYAAAYKRPSEADSGKWVVSGYFQSEWMAEEAEKCELPVVLNMGALYQAILQNLSPVPIRVEESLSDLVERVDQLHLKEREADKLTIRITKEKQFNRRVELNRILNKLKLKIEPLKR